MKHRPSIIGCAAGFGAAGSGVGSLIGTWLWSTPQLLDAGAPTNEKVWAFYGGTLLGIVIGIGVGAIVGVGYALLARKSVRRRSGPKG